MRLRHPDGSIVHLAYCTNVHPAEDLDGIVAQLDRYAVAVRDQLGAERLGLGLWLPRDAATRLTDDASALRRLRLELERRRLEVVTLNGFPYRGFQNPVVKHAVYHPDWSERARLEYTRDLTRILVELLPDDVAEGSVSTIPFGWREDWSDQRHSAALHHLKELTAWLSELSTETSRSIRVGLEPEPGCVVETSEDAVTELSGIATENLGICLDACHLAVAFEDPSRALARLREAALSVVKAQASCALRAHDPRSPRARTALESFAEPRFLHQTREADLNQTVDDLRPALAGRLPGRRPWRIHFHTPLHADPEPPLDSTRDVLTETLRALLGNREAFTRHIEVETYTWDVLPHRHTGDLVSGIAAELAWTRERLVELGLTEVGE